MTADCPSALSPPQRGIVTTVQGAVMGTARERTQQRCRQTGAQSQTTQALTWVFRTDALFATFAQWWRSSLRNGSLPTRIALPNGYAFALTAVRFLGPYVATDLNDGWQVTATVELLAPPRLSADDVAGLIAYGGLDLSADAAALHLLANTTFPADLA